jgi:hypothetical protein
MLHVPRRGAARNLEFLAENLLKIVKSGTGLDENKKGLPACGSHRVKFANKWTNAGNRVSRAQAWMSLAGDWCHISRMSPVNLPRAPQSAQKAPQSVQILVRKTPGWGWVLPQVVLPNFERKGRIV